MQPEELGSVLESIRMRILWPMATRGRLISKCRQCSDFLDTQVDLYLLIWSHFRSETKGWAKPIRKMLLAYITHYKKVRALVRTQGDLLQRLDKIKIGQGSRKGSFNEIDLEEKFEAKLKE